MTESGMEPTTPSPTPPIWNRPWFIVLAVIALVLVIWAAVSMGGETDTGTATTVGQTSDTTSPESATTVGPTDSTAPEDVSETTTAAETTPAPPTTVVSTTAATPDDTLAVGGTGLTEM